MKISRYLENCAGFTFIELLVVFVIIGVMASIAIPHYAEYRGKALEAQCKSNRYHIEMEEMAYFAEHGTPSLKINDKYSCPSGGTYVWLVMDPKDRDYPKIGCSIHFIGTTKETTTTTDETPAPTETPVDVTPVTPVTPVVETPVPITPAPVVETPAEKPSPEALTDSLTEYLGTLSIPKNTAKQLLSVLDSAKASIANGDNKQAINSYRYFYK